MIISTAGVFRQVDRNKQKSKLPFFLRFIDCVNRILPSPIKKFISLIPFMNILIRRQASSAAPDGLIEIVVSTGILKGTRLKLNLKTERNFWLDKYEKHLMRAIHEFCKAGMIIYDIGANIGYISIAFARIIGKEGKVYAFEPLPENVQRISDHIAINSLQKVIHLVPYAVSDYEGTEIFLTYQHHSLSRFANIYFNYGNCLNQIKVKSLRLDDFIYRDKNSPPHVIKMDIEGGGVKAIPGMLKVISDAHPLFLMELHGQEEQQLACSTLKKYGYKICKMQRKYPEITNLNSFGIKDYIVGIPKDI